MKGCVSVARITMQELADSLGTSRITVWKALTNRPGVSDTLRAEIQHKAQELGYYAAERTAHAQPQRTFSVVVARPESSAFWMQIIHYAAKELALHGINLMYTYMPALYRPGYELPASLEGGAVGGFIVLNIYDQELLRLLSKSPLPKVFLDTIPAMPERALGGDLLIIEAVPAYAISPRACWTAAIAGWALWATSTMPRPTWTATAAFWMRTPRTALRPIPH